MDTEQERIDQLAASFADQLQLLHPNGKTLDDIKIKEYIRNFVGGFTESSSDLLLEPNQLVKAFHLAASKWQSKESKAISSTTSGVASFSLLDQLQGGFALPVTIDEIKEAATDTERLVLFQKISYVDDVLPDWREFRSLLKSSLQNSNSSSSSSSDTQTTIALEYIKVHRKLFGLCRSSAEYDSLAYNLCQNLMEVAITTIGDASSSLETDFFISLMQNWRDMFLDLMQRDRYVASEAMEMDFLNILRTMSRPNHAIQPYHILSLVDPRAMWFQSWVQHVAPRHLVYILEKNGGIMPDLLRRSRANDDISERSKELAPPVIQTARLQAVSILSHIVCKTRAALFPWKILSNIQNTKPLELSELTSSPSDDEDQFQIQLYTPDKATLNSMLQLFLDALAYDEKDEYKLTCWTAIETLLWGYKCFDVDAAGSLSLVKKSLEEIPTGYLKGSYTARLHEVMSLLE